MSSSHRKSSVMLACVVLYAASSAGAQDWPQWRGADRDAKATGFKAPQTWPEALKQQWRVEIGDGVATPAVVGGKVYAFSREGGNEIIRCLDAADGKEIWQHKYAAAPVQGAASGFSGPRASPTVADGKVVTLGVHGVLTCLDASTGKQLWQNKDYEGSVPRFAASSSPLVVDGMCIVQVGSDSSGGIVAYDLSTGSQNWKWDADGSAYGSPVLMTVGGTKMIVAPTGKNMVALRVNDGTQLWRVAYEQGRYNAATPIVDGDRIIYAGPTRGSTAMKLTKQGDTLAAEELWRNTDNSLMFNTPVLKDDLLYGVSNQNSLFCVNATNGQTAWTASLSQSEGGGGRRRRGGGYGSVVDAGSVLFALTPAGEMVVFKPVAEAFEKLASYKVAEAGTYAYPVLVGNRVFVKDQNALTLWIIE